VPDVPVVERSWEAPRVPVPPGPARTKTAGGSEVDRDADIADFNAALDKAPAAAPPWPQPQGEPKRAREENAPAADEKHGEEIPEEL
jgi:hypothetical protein